MVKFQSCQGGRAPSPTVTIDLEPTSRANAMCFTLNPPPPQASAFASQTSTAWWQALPSPHLAGHLPFASTSVQGSGESQQGVPWLREQLLKLPFMAGVREQREQLQEQQKAPTKKQLKIQKKQEAKNTPPTLVRRAPLRPPPYELDAVDKQLWEAFTEMDVNADDRIDWVELRSALERLGLPCTPEYLVSMMNEYDLNRDNVIDWEEFRYYVHKREVEIEKAFKHFDANGDGQISCAELRTVLHQAGIPARAADVEAMISHVDGDHNAMISYEEFRRFAAFLPNAAQISSNPMLYAAWWRNTSALVTPTGREMAVKPKPPTRVVIEVMGRGAMALAFVCSVQGFLSNDGASSS